MNSLTKFGLIINLFLFLFDLMNSFFTKEITISLFWTTITFSIDANFITIIIIGIGLACALLGARVLGSGISNSSVQIITIIITSLMIWFLSTLFTLKYFESIPVFGSILYWTLTIIYSLGMLIDIQSIASGGGGEE